jgi:hypothetical protein
MFFLLQFSFDPAERGRQRLGVLAHPAIVDETDRDGIQEVELLPAALARDHEIGLLEHTEVLHHTEARHRQLSPELAQRLAVAAAKLVKELPPGRRGERSEYNVLVHASEYT